LHAAPAARTERPCDFDDRRGAWRAKMQPAMREPRLAEPFHAPPEFLCVAARQTPVPLPLGGKVRPAALRRFVSAMAAHGQPVQAARLGYDRLYAFDCFARAHACEDAALRALALELFAAFDTRGR
jgi:hypothetical protein